MAAAAADAEERAERLVGLLPGGGGRPLFVDILQWELGLDQKRKVVVRGQERIGDGQCCTPNHILMGLGGRVKGLFGGGVPLLLLCQGI